MKSRRRVNSTVIHLRFETANARIVRVVQLHGYRRTLRTRLRWRDFFLGSMFCAFPAGPRARVTHGKPAYNAGLDNKSLDASGGGVFRSMTGPAMLD